MCVWLYTHTQTGFREVWVCLRRDEDTCTHHGGLGRPCDFDTTPTSQQRKTPSDARPASSHLAPSLLHCFYTSVPSEISYPPSDLCHWLIAVAAPSSHHYNQKSEELGKCSDTTKTPQIALHELALRSSADRETFLWSGGQQLSSSGVGCGGEEPGFLSTEQNLGSAGHSSTGREGGGASGSVLKPPRWVGNVSVLQSFCTRLCLYGCSFLSPGGAAGQLIYCCCSFCSYCCSW